MVSPAAESERPYDASLRQGQVRHALKTALACCLATGLSYFFHVPSGQLAPVFAYLLMTLGMPSPRLNWLVTQLVLVVSAAVSACILVAFAAAPFLHLVVTLLWIFVCVLFTNWVPLPATLGAMVSALGIFVFYEGGVGAALGFYVAYDVNFLIAGFSVVVVHTLLWELNTRKVFLQRVAAVYARLEDECRDAARRLRSGDPAPVDAAPAEWAPFRPLRQFLAPELRRVRDTANPFARMILACRSMNLRLWFFRRAIAPLAPPALPADVHLRMATLLDRCAGHLHALLDGILRRQEVPAIDTDLVEEADAVRREAGIQRSEGGMLLAHGIDRAVLHRIIHGLQTLTTSHNAVLATLRAGLAGELVTLQAFPTGRKLVDLDSVHAGVKLVLILLLLLGEEIGLGFRGGSQVAFFATFFASTGNLGRQNKTDLVGLAGLLGGFGFGVAAAFLTSRVPEFPLMLALVFLSQFVANLAFQRLPRYGAAGLQAGLALPFAYLATTGPEWGSFSTATTRFWGLVVAGFSAVVVHAYLWPVLPMRQLRASIAAALRDTAARLGHLFAGPRSAWEGPPPSLDDVVIRARDLLDDARYLPGPEHADPAYDGIVGCLQEIDANLEYVHFLVGLENEHPLRQRFFDAVADYPEHASGNLERVARQFEQTGAGAASMTPVRWKPDVSGRWEEAERDLRSVPHTESDPWRPMVIARCLDDIARAIEKMSSIGAEINVRNSTAERAARYYSSAHRAAAEME